MSPQHSPGMILGTGKEKANLLPLHSQSLAQSMAWVHPEALQNQELLHPVFSPPTPPDATHSSAEQGIAGGRGVKVLLITISHPHSCLEIVLLLNSLLPQNHLDL